MRNRQDRRRDLLENPVPGVTRSHHAVKRVLCDGAVLLGEIGRSQKVHKRRDPTGRLVRVRVRLRLRLRVRVRLRVRDRVRVRVRVRVRDRVRVRVRVRLRGERTWPRGRRARMRR